MSDRLEIARLAFLSLSKAERRVFLETFGTSTKTTATPASNAERIVRRNEFAQRFARSPRWADRMAAEGHIRKVVVPGRRRAMGFRESDVQALIGRA